MRTSEQFNSILQDLKWWLNFHKKPVWLVPRENDYCLSVIKPEPHELPIGTASNFYDVGLEIKETVTSSNF